MTMRALIHRLRYDRHGYRRHIEPSDNWLAALPWGLGWTAGGIEGAWRSIAGCHSLVMLGFNLVFFVAPGLLFICCSFEIKGDRWR